MVDATIAQEACITSLTFLYFRPDRWLCSHPRASAPHPGRRGPNPERCRVRGARVHRRVPRGRAAAGAACAALPRRQEAGGM